MRVSGSRKAELRLLGERTVQERVAIYEFLNRSEFTVESDELIASTKNGGRNSDDSEYSVFCAPSRGARANVTELHHVE